MANLQNAGVDLENAKAELQSVRIHITGIVQGVGFRPYVFGLATRLALTGWVRNTSAGVDIEITAPDHDIQAFFDALQRETPPLAQIDEITSQWLAPQRYTSFEILDSQPVPDAFQPISPDVSICPDCLRELFTASDRRYRYPFINCTNCGPRFTIIQDIPYDRQKTTMSGFSMCPKCAEEYSNPLDRRFHAQPIACPVCGPQVWLEDRQGQVLSRRDDAIQETQRMLASGKIVAIKGLGGFHLACDATNSTAVAELRRRKLRIDKPFALMAFDIHSVETQCTVNPVEKIILESRERPIVILRRSTASTVSTLVAPNQAILGVMLPYTPLHYLILAPNSIENAGKHSSSMLGDQPPILVMTSGNLSEEPIATDNADARQKLTSLADVFLMHDRPIHTRTDDSVVRVTEDSLYPLRRSRGYAPFPVYLSSEHPSILAVGAELKNTFCITRGSYAFLSHHIGDMENFETLRSFEEGIAHFERLFRVQPEALAYDLHPDYLATRYALDRSRQTGLPAYGIQHHHAHIAACMAENNLPADQSVIGVAFDGTGYGEDGAIWGGEFLITQYDRYERVAHLAYLPLIGGDHAIRQPWRIALAWLRHAGLEWTQDLPAVKVALQNFTSLRDPLKILDRQIKIGLNAPLTSSMGRLFDAAASLIGIRQEVNYEAQAAIELENLVHPDETGCYPFQVVPQVSDQQPTPNHQKLIDPSPLIQSIIRDFNKNVPLPLMAARFHNGVANMVENVCSSLRQEFELNQVVLSGGVWQNITLLGKTTQLLRKSKFEVFLHHKVPANDGGIALGQAVVACHRLKGEQTTTS